MKNACSILFVLLAASACAQSLQDITSISLTKQTRGFIEEVIIDRDSVQGYSENHRTTDNAHQYTTETGEDGWVRLMLALKDVPLEKIDGLQSPTMNRAHDGAIHSSIEIKFEDGSSITHSFDDENPHPDLQPLMDAIRELRIPPR